MSGHYNLVSWNVNGLRAVIKKGFLDLLLEQRFDTVCIQETKVSPDKIPRAHYLQVVNFQPVK